MKKRLAFLSFCSISLATIVFTLTVAFSGDRTIDENQNLDAHLRQLSDDRSSLGFADEKLGDGAYAEWSSDGIENDWTHHWWDLHKGAGLSVGDINEIYAYTDPDIDDWYASIVYDTLKDSAVDGGYISENTWNYYELGNGIDH